MKKTLLVSLMALTIVTSCKKDQKTFEELPSDLKVSKKALSVTSTNSTDSLTALITEFNLTKSDQKPEEMVTVNVNSYEEARKFITDLNTSEFEKKAIPRNGLTMTSDPKNSTSRSFMGDRYFSFELPAASLIILKRFRFNWPSGFQVSGNLNGEGAILNAARTRWQFSRISCDNAQVNFYGLSLGSSYENHSISFQEQGFGRGTDAVIRFRGVLKLAIAIKDEFVIWDKLVNSNISVRFGPYLYYGGAGEDLNLDRTDTRVLQYISY